MLKVYFLGLCILLMAHCGSEQAPVPPSENPVDKDKAIVEDITGTLMTTRMESMVTTAGKLAASTRQGCSPEGVDLETLREDWTQSMKVFHFLEAVPYGVLMKNKVGGCTSGELACRIYSFPFQNENAVAIEMQNAKDEGDSYEFLTGSESAIGLDALEYILFEVLKSEERLTESSVACPYVEHLGRDIGEASESLLEAFKTEDLVQTSQGNSGAQLREQLNEITGALSFFKQTLLYIKVNRLLGLPGSSSDDVAFDCSDDCYFYMEHPWSLMAKDALKWNLESFQQIYTGDVQDAGKKVEGFGIQDYLEEINKGTEAEVPLELTGKIQTLLNGFESGASYQKAVEDFAGADCAVKGGVLCILQEEASALASWLTVELPNYLSIEATRGGVQGDND